MMETKTKLSEPGLLKRRKSDEFEEKNVSSLNSSVEISNGVRILNCVAVKYLSIKFNIIVRASVCK